MKYLQNTLLCLLVLFSISIISAQTVPAGMKYQAVARNTVGEVLPNKSITLKIELKNGDQSFYSEEHQVETNQIGLFDLVVGGGTVTQGKFDLVPWSTNEIWMSVSIKETGKDKSFAAISESKLLAVPYAFHAISASKLTGDDRSDHSINSRNPNGVPSQVWSLKGNSNTDPSRDRLGTTDAADLIFITNNEERLKISSDGNINIKNDLDVDKNLAVGEDLNVKKNVNLNTEEGETVNYGPFEVANSSPTNLTGTLDVDMETQLNDDLTVEGNTVLEDQLIVRESATLESTLEVDGNTTLNSQLKVENNQPTILTGDLNVEQNAAIQNDLTVEGQTSIKSGLIVDQNTWLNGQTIIDYFPGINNQGDASLYSHNLIVEGNLQGIAVKLEASSPNTGNNFITFFNRNNGALGRIEGSGGIQGGSRAIIISLLGEPTEEDADKLSIDKNQAPDYGIPGGAGDYFTSEYAFGSYQLTLEVVADITRFLVNTIAFFSAGIGDADDVIWTAVDVFKGLLQLGGYLTYNEIFEGVAFESGGADYAEWLPKQDREEHLVYGDVVGVKGGEISKKFVEAEKFMVVSHAPAVIGGAPNTEDISNYTKIAFMGQVAVKVLGETSKGDYILPSGNGDGMAMSVKPEKMKALDYQRVIGIAWADSEPDKAFSFINTAVGINSNDLASTVNQMQNTLNEIQKVLQKLSPDFQPTFYDTKEGVLFNQEIEQGYSQAASLRDEIKSAMDERGYESVKEALAVAQEYVNMQNVNLSDFPYLEEVFSNPTPETLLKAQKHYQGVMKRLESLGAEIAYLKK